MVLALQDSTARDLTTVGRCLPPHMLVLMMEQCSKIGLEMRADVLHRLNVASISPLAKCSTIDVARLARKTDDFAKALLHDLSPDDPREGLYVCAMFCLVLVEEGRLDDKTNMAVLVSLMLMDDVKDGKPDTSGEGAVWRLEEARWKHAARNLLQRATIMGLYHQLELSLH